MDDYSMKELLVAQTGLFISVGAWIVSRIFRSLDELKEQKTTCLQNFANRMATETEFNRIRKKATTWFSVLRSWKQKWKPWKKGPSVRPRTTTRQMCLPCGMICQKGLGRRAERAATHTVLPHTKRSEYPQRADTRPPRRPGRSNKPWPNGQNRHLFSPRLNRK